MRKTLIVLMALGLVACDADPSGVKYSAGTLDADVSIWRDPSTGCNYLFMPRHTGTSVRIAWLSIRYRANGTADCPVTK